MGIDLTARRFGAIFVPLACRASCKILPASAAIWCGRWQNEPLV